MTHPLRSAARFRLSSDQSLLVSFGDKINRETHGSVVKVLRLLESEPIPGVRNLHPAYCSILIKFDPLRTGHDQLSDTLAGYLERANSMPLPEPRVVEIPACYGGEWGPDLADICSIHQLSIDRVIELHTSTTYVVYFLGFCPGFAYLGELPEALITPRLPTPRKKVPPGSVAIAANQTGVYPFATPGGWRILGRTPLKMFQPERQGLSLVSVGDHVRFKPISAAEFAEMERA
jgi:inhibitor of KinA